MQNWTFRAAGTVGPVACWSVLVRGHAHQVTDGRAVQRLEDGMHLAPWAPGARDVYVRIVPAQITGRRIQPS